MALHVVYDLNIKFGYFWGTLCNKPTNDNQIITETTIHSGLFNDIIQLGSSEF